MTKSLFPEPDEPPITPETPLAERLRPRTLDELIGQEHLIGKGKVLRAMVEQDQLTSIILWGPPGTGKDDSCADHGETDPISFCRHTVRSCPASKK